MVNVRQGENGFMHKQEGRKAEQEETHQAFCVLSDNDHINLSRIGLYALHRSDICKEAKLLPQLDDGGGVSLDSMRRRRHSTEHG